VLQVFPGGEEAKGILHSKDDHGDRLEHTEHITALVSRPTVHLRYALGKDSENIGDDEEEDERAEHRRCPGTNDAARPHGSHLTAVEKLISAHLHRIDGTTAAGQRRWDPFELLEAPLKVAVPGLLPPHTLLAALRLTLDDLVGRGCAGGGEGRGRGGGGERVKGGREGEIRGGRREGRGRGG
jgi:hypothetical protein